MEVKLGNIAVEYSTQNDLDVWLVKYLKSWQYAYLTTTNDGPRHSTWQCYRWVDTTFSVTSRQCGSMFCTYFMVFKTHLSGLNYLWSQSRDGGLWPGVQQSRAQSWGGRFGWVRGWHGDTRSHQPTGRHQNQIPGRSPEIDTYCIWTWTMTFCRKRSSGGNGAWKTWDCSELYGCVLVEWVTFSTQKPQAQVCEQTLWKILPSRSLLHGLYFSNAIKSMPRIIWQKNKLCENISGLRHWSWSCD